MATVTQHCIAQTDGSARINQRYKSVLPLCLGAVRGSLRRLLCFVTLCGGQSAYRSTRRSSIAMCEYLIIRVWPPGRELFNRVILYQLHQKERQCLTLPNHVMQTLQLAFLASLTLPITSSVVIYLAKLVKFWKFPILQLGR